MEYDFEASLGYWTTVASMAFRRALNEELAPLGITSRQMQVLAWLLMQGELSQGELAQRMEIEPPTLAGIITRMEQAGWVTRRSCTHDRRRKYVCLQPAAEPVWRQIADSARKVRSRANAGLSPEQIELLTQLLKTLHGNLTGPLMAVPDESERTPSPLPCPRPRHSDLQRQDS